MDFSKIKTKDLLNPRKWRDFAAGTYYEAKMGFYKCEQLIHYLTDDDIDKEVKDRVCKLDRQLWEAYKLESKLFAKYDNVAPVAIDHMRDKLDQSILQEYFQDIPIYFAEQAVYRSFLCGSCLSSKHCSHCGCTMPAGFMAPTNECSGGKWRGFHEEESWIVYRNVYQIKISL